MRKFLVNFAFLVFSIFEAIVFAAFLILGAKVIVSLAQAIWGLW